MSRRRSRNISPPPIPLDLASVALLVAIVSIPAYFNIQSSTSFEPDKGALLRSFAAIALVFLASEAINYLRAGSRPTWSQFSLPVKLLAGFVVVILLSTIAGVDFVTSLWGNYERGYGLLSLLAGIIVGSVAYRMARSGQQWLLIDAILLAAVIPMVYGLLQVIGYDPVVGQTVSFTLGQRASSSLGNPLFLADFLLLVIPLGIARLVLGESRSKLFRAGLGVYLGLLVLTLVATKSLTALGASITAGAFLLVAVGRLQHRRWFTMTGLLVLAGGFLLLLLAWLIPETLPWRLGDIFASGGSGGQRLLIWQAVLDLMRNEPRWLFTGLGPDGLALKIAPYLSPEFAHFEVDWFFRLPDRAHTWPLELLSAGGALAFILWTLFLVAVMARLMPDVPNRRWLSILLPVGGAILGAVLGMAMVGLAAIPIGLTAGLFGGVLAVLLWSSASPVEKPAVAPDLSPYLLAALVGHWLFLTFSFSTHAPDLLFWAIVGLALGGGVTTKASMRPGTKRRQQPERSPHFVLAGIACATFGFSLSAAWPAVLPLWLACMFILFLLAWGLSPTQRGWMTFFFPALALIPALLLNQRMGLPAWLAYTWLLIWLLAMVWLVLPTKNRRKFMPALIALFPLLLVLNLPVYGDIAYKSAISQPASEDRIIFMNRALLLSPHDHTLLYGIAYVENYLLAADATLEQAQSQHLSALYQQAQQAQPLAPEPYAAYADWLRQRGVVDQTAIPLAFENFDHALALSPNDIQTRNHLALLRWQSGDSEGASNDFNALLVVDSLYGPTYLNLAQMQRSQGDLDGARATLLAGVAKVPWWPDLQQALDELQ